MPKLIIAKPLGRPREDRLAQILVGVKFYAVWPIEAQLRWQISRRLSVEMGNEFVRLIVPADQRRVDHEHARRTVGGAYS
jgi:hypothetical protein